MKNIDFYINKLEQSIKNPNQGLPEEVFLFISRLTPLINVDLLVKDENNRTLLAWRNDEYYGDGWHIPGGIVRFQETIENRIKKVAEIEIGTIVEFNRTPLKLTEFISNTKNRSHGISLLYSCFLTRNYVPENKGFKKTDQGYLKWHETCPKKLLKIQEIYRDYINGDYHGKL